jgi:hypothetical protein
MCQYKRAKASNYSDTRSNDVGILGIKERFYAGDPQSFIVALKMPFADKVVRIAQVERRK